MARIRTIKPDFFTSEDIVGLSPLARLLYIATWLEADREGRMAWRPRTLKLRYLPGDTCDIDALADELLVHGLVVLYTLDGQQYACIPTFTRHQVINNRESPSVLPAPPDAINTGGPRVDDASTTRADATSTRLVGKERKGKEGRDDASTARDDQPSADAPPPGSKNSKPRKHKMPAGFSLSDRVKAWASGKGFDRLDEHLEAFKAKVAANGYTYADWDAAFMEAIRGDWAKLRPPKNTGNATAHNHLNADEQFVLQGDAECN